MPKIEKILGELTENSPELPRFGIIVDIFTARKRSLGQGNVFTPVCHDQEGSASSGVGQTPPPPRDTWYTMGYGQQAGGTLPTGMHSCEICDRKENFENFNLYMY